MNELNILPDLKLRFNIEYPDLEECYQEGYESAVEGFLEEQNPYKLNSLEYDYWQEGWIAGYCEEEPTLHLLEKENKITHAANEKYPSKQEFFVKFLKITGALAATALVGYQVLELVA